MLTDNAKQEDFTVSITNPEFLALFLVYIYLYNIAPRIFRSGWLFLLANVIFIIYFFGTLQALLLIFFCLVGYVLALALKRNNKIGKLLPVVTILVLYAALKKYSFLPLPDMIVHLPEVVGVSYIIFRVVNVIFDIAESPAQCPLQIDGYLNYCLSFCTILSGPIQKYNCFLRDYNNINIFSFDEEACTESFVRFTNGLVKVLIVSPLLFSIHTYFASGTEKVLLGMLLGGYKQVIVYEFASTAYLVYLYFNFSGYTDMVIGMARCIGYNLPENFSKPFDSENFLEFWSRWHMSLSFWFRDNVFNPVLKILVRRWPSEAAVKYYSVAMYFLIFFLIGLWHGRTMAFMFCGLALASGASINKLYQIGMLNWLGRNISKSLGRNQFVRIASAGLTTLWISIAITGLWLPWSAMVELYDAATLPTMAAGFGLGALIMGASTFALRKCTRFIGGAKDNVAEYKANLPLTQFSIAAKLLFVIIYSLVTYENAPLFVYQWF